MGTIDIPERISIEYAREDVSRRQYTGLKILFPFSLKTPKTFLSHPSSKLRERFIP